MNHGAVERSRLVGMTIRNIGCIGPEGLTVELDDIVCLVRYLRSLCSLRLNVPGGLFDNRLIFGDNLVALKALEQEFDRQIREAWRAATVALTLE